MEMTTEARALLALLEEKRPMARMVPGLSDAFAAVGAYVQRAELRTVALEESARTMAETILRRHFGDTSMTREQLETMAATARDEPLLRTLADQKKAGWV